MLHDKIKQKIGSINELNDKIKKGDFVAENVLSFIIPVRKFCKNPPLKP